MKPPQDANGFEAAVGASASQMADISWFLETLRSGSRDFNLVGPSALGEFWPRHAFDSAQLLRLAPGAARWADLGAGAGFPGVMLAILLKPRPDAHVHLIESQLKRSRFLQRVVDTLDLPATVHPVRAESLAPAPRCDIVTARACAPLKRLFGYAAPFFRTGATGLFLKGRTAAAELADAASTWRADAELLPSLSDPDGRVVRVARLARAAVRPPIDRGRSVARV